MGRTPGIALALPLLGALLTAAAGCASGGSWIRTEPKKHPVSVEVPRDWKILAADLGKRRMLRAFAPGKEAGLMVVEQKAGKENSPSALSSALAEFQFYAEDEGYFSAGGAAGMPRRTYEAYGTGLWKGAKVRIVARSRRDGDRDVISVAYARDENFDDLKGDLVRMVKSAK